MWALSSDVNDEVQCHIYYAELLWYEHNIICPPLYAGTVQCSPLNVHEKSSIYKQNGGAMGGGNFTMNMKGLAHCKKYGYKGKNSNDPYGSYNFDSSCQYSSSSHISSPQESFDMKACFDNHHENSELLNDFWVIIPYQAYRWFSSFEHSDQKSWHPKTNIKELLRVLIPLTLMWDIKCKKHQSTPWGLEKKSNGSRHCLERAIKFCTTTCLIQSY